MDVWRGVLYFEVFIEMISSYILNVNWVEENLVGVRPYRGEVVVRYFCAKRIPNGLFNFVACSLFGHLACAVGSLAASAEALRLTAAAPPRNQNLGADYDG